jgi:site-specific DNA-adenine methylase
VGDFIGHFKGWITIPQVCMFFYYLNKAKLMPNYSASSLGQLAVPLFSRNEKGVRDDYPNTSSYRDDKKRLEEFKQVLDALQKEFEEDYKKAR